VSREAFVEMGDEILGHIPSDPSATYPERMAKRHEMLRRRGLENLYDYLDEHPSGPSRPHEDREFPIVF
jgi:hypothetical protein